MVINITNTFVTISISFYNQQRLSFLCSDSIEYHLKTVGSLSRKSHILANIYIYFFLNCKLFRVSTDPVKPIYGIYQGPKALGNNPIHVNYWALYETPAKYSLKIV